MNQQPFENWRQTVVKLFLFVCWLTNNIFSGRLMVEKSNFFIFKRTVILLRALSSENPYIASSYIRGYEFFLNNVIPSFTFESKPHSPNLLFFCSSEWWANFCSKEVKRLNSQVILVVGKSLCEYNLVETFVVSSIIRLFTPWGMSVIW